MKQIPDLVIGVLLAAAAAAATHAGYRQLAPAISHYSTWDYWFESDPPAFVSQLTDAASPHHSRDSHHPLSSLLLFPPAAAIRALGVADEGAIGVLMALTAAACAALFFTILRVAGLARADAVVFSVLSGASASAVFWFPVPETLVFGTLSVLAAVAVVALHERGVGLPEGALVLIAAGTFAFTSTNGAAGLLMLALVLPRRRALAVGAGSLAVVAGGWCVQRLVFPSAGFPLDLTTDAETLYLFSPESLGLLRKSVVFLFHSIVMPELGNAYGFRLSLQAMSPGSGGALAGLGVALWGALLAVAAFALTRSRRGRLAPMVAGVVATQWLVAMVFGIETFFYSAHWAPFLVMLCALGARTPLRPALTTLAAALALVAVVHNVRAFGEAARSLRERYASQRAFTEAVARLTPSDAVLACGLHAAAAQGEPPRPAEPDLRRLDVVEIGLEREPDTCFFHFPPGLTPARRGFLLSYERWSPEAIEALRGCGARYFVTSYAWGLAHAPELRAALDARYRRLEAPAGASIYDLASDASASRP